MQIFADDPNGADITLSINLEVGLIEILYLNERDIEAIASMVAKGADKLDRDILLIERMELSYERIIPTSYTRRDGWSRGIIPEPYQSFLKKLLDCETDEKLIMPERLNRFIVYDLWLDVKMRSRDTKAIINARHSWYFDYLNRLDEILMPPDDKDEDDEDLWDIPF